VSDNEKDKIIKEDWMNIEKTIEVYDNFGEVESYYLPLTPLLKHSHSI